MPPPLLWGHIKDRPALGGGWGADIHQEGEERCWGEVRGGVLPAVALFGCTSLQTPAGGSNCGRGWGEEICLAGAPLPINRNFGEGVQYVRGPGGWEEVGR